MSLTRQCMRLTGMAHRGPLLQFHQQLLPLRICHLDRYTVYNLVQAIGNMEEEAHHIINNRKNAQQELRINVPPLLRHRVAPDGNRNDII